MFDYGVDIYLGLTTGIPLTCTLEFIISLQEDDPITGNVLMTPDAHCNWIVSTSVATVHVAKLSPSES